MYNLLRINSYITKFDYCIYLKMIQFLFLELKLKYYTLTTNTIYMENELKDIVDR